jgi:hypothetical protein
MSFPDITQHVFAVLYDFRGEEERPGGVTLMHRVKYAWHVMPDAFERGRVDV